MKRHILGWINNTKNRLKRKKLLSPLKPKVIKETANSDIAKHLILGVHYAYLSGVEDDIAEFGTMTGISARTIARAMALLRCPKTLRLFDSFQGMAIAESPLDKTHPFVLAGAWKPGRLKGLNKDELTRIVCKMGLSRDKIKVYEGWFSDTLPELPDDIQFSMLHIDCDLYQSTMDVLDVCFSRKFISEGAMILFDDWNMAIASPKLGERKAWSEIVDKYAVNYSDEGGCSWNAHKFIIHDYCSTV